MSRRAVLAALGASVALAGGGRLVAQPARPAFGQWVESFRARARARGVSDATYSRVMEPIKPDTSVYALDRAQPEFREEVWQYLNRRVSDWRIRTGRERAREHAACSNVRRARVWGRPLGHAGPVGHGVGLRRRGGEPQAHAADPAGAIGAGLGRAAPARLLGAGAPQRAGDRRARLGGARRDDRLVGRRHGPHPMDAGGVAQHGRRLQRRRSHLAVRASRRRAGRHRAVPAATRQISPRRGLGLRGTVACRRRAGSDGDAGHFQLAGAGGQAGERQSIPAAERAGARCGSRLPAARCFLSRRTSMP